MITNGLSVAPHGRITKNEVIALKFQKEPQAEKTDFSNLRGQAPVATRKKELRNIIVPQEEIIIKEENETQNNIQKEKEAPKVNYIFKNKNLSNKGSLEQKIIRQDNNSTEKKFIFKNTKDKLDKKEIKIIKPKASQSPFSYFFKMKEQEKEKNNDVYKKFKFKQLK